MNAMVRIRALFILLAFAPSAASQTSRQDQTNGSAARGSISGRVRIAGQAASDVVVTLATQNQNSHSELVAAAKTNAEGRFHLMDVAAGKYVIRSFAPAYHDDSDQRSNITLSDGQNIESVEINLVLGGVITGRIIGKDGQPAVWEPVEAVSADSHDVSRWPASRHHITSDDRGVYRIYGLPPGGYLVRAGTDIENTSRFVPANAQPLTFHPGVIDRNKAAVVRVRSGEEVTGIDIVFGPPRTLFEARGQVVDAETGQPVAGARLEYGRIRENEGPWSGSILMEPSNAQGFFRVRRLSPGRFNVKAEVDGANRYCEPAEFEIKDGDVSDLKVLLHKGATISGTVQMEPAADRGTPSRPRVMLSALGSTSARGSAGHFVSIRACFVSPEGAFQLTGLPGGEVRIRLTPQTESPPIVISRIDHPTMRTAVEEGFLDPEGVLTIQPGEQINDVRIVISERTGGVRGTVKLIGGTVPLGGDLRITVYGPIREGRYIGKHIDADANGKFEAKGLRPGQYRLKAEIILPYKQSDRPPPVLQGDATVTVANNVEEIEMVIDFRKPGR